VKPDELLEYFASRFIPCYQFLKRDVDWICLDGKIHWLVYLSLQQFESEINVDKQSSNDPGDLQVTNQPNLIPNKEDEAR